MKITREMSSNLNPIEPLAALGDLHIVLLPAVLAEVPVKVLAVEFLPCVILRVEPLATRCTLGTGVQPLDGSHWQAGVDRNNDD